MAFGSVSLVPGVNTERTPTLNQAGYSATQLGRFKDSLFQKLGGWQQFYSAPVSGVPRDLHPWQDLNQNQLLSVATTTRLNVISDGVLQDITPQALTTDFTPDFTTNAASSIVEIKDTNIANVTPFDSVFFNTPVSVGGLILSGLYPIVQSTGTDTYTIDAGSNASSSVANGGAVPEFSTISGSSVVTVTLNDHGMSAGDVIVFPIPTTVNGVTIESSYQAITISSANAFTIQTNDQATGTGSAFMNGGDAELVYYITLGPAPLGAGYGLGAYSAGGYGTGVVPTNQTGTPIAATDWSQDNWGELLVACPKGGGIYYYGPSSGYTNASLITQAPAFNSGIFISNTAQILVAYGSATNQQIGVLQDPLLVQWCDAGNLFDWTPTTANQAGNYRIPLGSEIRGGMAVSNVNLIWTDLDLWAMNYVGVPDVYGFNKIGAGAGLASSHAAQQLRGSVYWMGASNFFVYNNGGVSVIPCPVWDAVFQNLNTAYIQNVRALPNTNFNEAGWAYPSLNSANGECDSYVKMNITDPGAPWDNGTLARSAWCDESVLGPPIGASPAGQIFQHETTNNANGQPLVSSFTTGYFFLAEGEDFVSVDQILPDFKYTEYGQSNSAQIQMTFNVIDYIGDTPRTYGPYTVQSTTRFIGVRFRGRQMSITVSSSDLDSFWRIGRVRYRYSADGRR